MQTKVVKIKYDEFPELLQEIPDAPEHLHVIGTLPDPSTPILAVVGSRKYTTYGKAACESLIAGLRGYNVAIVSGLAMGIDSIAHRAALAAGLKTVAVPGSGLSPDVIYPRVNKSLAAEIVKHDGVLLSEFDMDFRATKWSFPQRNRIMAGLAHAVLLIEATERSGTLITARLAMDYNRDVLAVPGSVLSTSSCGTNKLIRDGATPITSPEDILEALGIQPAEKEYDAKKNYADLSDEETKIILHLDEMRTRDELVSTLGIPAKELNVLLMKLELKGIISEANGMYRKL